MAEMQTVNSMGIKSVAKFQATMMAVMYGLAGALMTLFGVIALLFGQGFSVIGMGLGVLILGALFGWVVGYLGGALGAYIYNIVAGKIGGIQIELTKGSPAPTPMPMPTQAPTPSA